MTVLKHLVFLKAVRQLDGGHLVGTTRCYGEHQNKKCDDFFISSHFDATIRSVTDQVKIKWIELSFCLRVYIARNLVANL